MDRPPDSDSSLLRWHLAFTKPAAEQAAKVHLERQGYRVYLPLVQQKTLRHGKWTERISALFPRYLFVQLDSAFQSLSPIRSTVGVAGLVRFGIDYTVVPNFVVSSLRSNEDPQTMLHRMKQSAWFSAGSAVRIARGALSGLEGIFESEDPGERVTVLLNLLGRETRISLPTGSVMPASGI